MITGSITTAQAGMQAQVERLEQVARRVAPGNLDRLPQDMVELSLVSYSFRANAATIRTADDMIGSLIDALT